MTFKVEVGPPQIAIHHAQTVLITDPDGQVTWPSEKGLYFLDTRLVSSWVVYANGEVWGFNNNTYTNGELGIGSANGPYMPVRVKF